MRLERNTIRERHWTKGGGTVCRGKGRPQEIVAPRRRLRQNLFFGQRSLAVASSTHFSLSLRSRKRRLELRLFLFRGRKLELYSHPPGQKTTPPTRFRSDVALRHVRGRRTLCLARVRHGGRLENGLVGAADDGAASQTPVELEDGLVGTAANEAASEATGMEGEKTFVNAADNRWAISLNGRRGLTETFVDVAAGKAVPGAAGRRKNRKRSSALPPTKAATGAAGEGEKGGLSRRLRHTKKHCPHDQRLRGQGE